MLKDESEDFVGSPPCHRDRPSELSNGAQMVCPLRAKLLDLSEKLLDCHGGVYGFNFDLAATDSGIGSVYLVSRDYIHAIGGRDAIEM